MKKALCGLALSAVAVSPAFAAGFVNGGFETGDTTGWTTGTGSRVSVNNTQLNPTAFLPGGSLFNPNLHHSAVVSQGVMPHTDGKLNQVFSGSFSFRAEDDAIGGFASAITQRVNNYTDPSIFFAWAATLEGAHGPNDAATFKLVLRDETTGTDIITQTANAASTGSGVDSRFALSSDNFFYTKQWQVEQLALPAADIGHDFSLTLLAADCQPAGHEGIVFLDGFGSVAPPPSAVPEPETYALMLAGLTLVGWVARRRHRRS